MVLCLLSLGWGTPAAAKLAAWKPSKKAELAALWIRGLRLLPGGLTCVTQGNLAEESAFCQASQLLSLTVLQRDYPDQVCSIARSLEIVGERWTLLILRDAFSA